MRVSVNASLLAAAAALAACGGAQSASPESHAEATPGDAANTTVDEAKPASSTELPPPAPPVEPSAAPAALGQTAPEFRLPDLDGHSISLASYRGKTVVLEWFNPGCPFIVYAHGDGPLRDMAEIPGAGDDNVVWLAINSGALGKQGHGVERNRSARDKWGIRYPVLIDETGAVGKLYEARTTPHMYVIDPKGALVYRGALDNAPLGRQDGDKRKNYVAEALADVAAGRAVRTPETKPYGCSVKY